MENGICSETNSPLIYVGIIKGIVICSVVISLIIAIINKKGILLLKLLDNL